MRTVLAGGRVLTPDGELRPAGVVIEDGAVVSVEEGAGGWEGEVVDVGGLTIAPGFIDLHVHGGGGLALATRDPQEMEAYARWVVAHGVTSFLATICAGSLESGLEFVRTAARVSSEIPGGANLLGLNLEGPFVSGERRGALPKGWPQPPDLRVFDGLAQAAAGRIKVMTMAPELPGAARMIRAAVEAGVTVSVGHTDAGHEAALQGFEAGATHITHGFNAMRAFHHRDPGPIGAALRCHKVTVEVIADGVHLHPATVELLVRSLDAGRVALVTDGVPPAGLESGVFRIGADEAHLAEGAVRLPDGTLAGSAATMDAVVRNVVTWGCADLAAAVRMASAVPARVLGLAHRKGAIAPGYDADLVGLTGDLQVAMTWVCGRPVYRRQP